MAVVARSQMTLEEFLADPTVDRHAEYIFGEVFEPVSESFLHLSRARFLEKALASVFGRDRTVRDADLPLANNRPRPDVVVLKEDFAVYEGGEGYTGKDVRLVVEVCLSTADRDYQIKDALYAEAGIPEYWIVDLVAKSVEKRTEPTPLGYSQREVFFQGSEILGIPVNDILGIQPVE